MALDLAGLYQRLQAEQRPVLPSGEHRAVVGCGYVGRRLVSGWSDDGHTVTATTRRDSRLHQLRSQVDQAVLFDSEANSNDLSFVSDVDVLVVSLAPTGQQHVCVEAYESVYSRGIEMLCEGIANRNSSRPLQIIHLSSCGLYGNRNGALTSEQMGLDLNHPVNALLAGAEQQIQSLRSEVVNVCTLRLGGIYGPDREIPEWLVAAAGQCVERNGDHVPCWVHVDDVVQAVNLAAEQKLNTTLNVVDDIKLSKRAITDQLCEAIGCAPVIWMGSTQDDRILHAAVSNQSLKDLGFQLQHPSMLQWYLKLRAASV